jgi:hypothetical protein
MFLGSPAAPHRVSLSQLLSASPKAASLEALCSTLYSADISHNYCFSRPYINMCAHARDLTDCNSCLIAQDAAFPFSWFASRGSIYYPAVSYRNPRAKNNCSREGTWKFVRCLRVWGAVSFTASDPAGPVVYLTSVVTTSYSPSLRGQL